MSLKVLVNGVSNSLARIQVQAGGIARLGKKVSVYRSGALRLVADFTSSGGGSTPLMVSASPTNVSGTSGSKTVSSNMTTVTAAGGVAPFTYSWARVSGSSAVSPTSPTLRNTTFRAMLGPGDSVSAICRCTVTDASGAVGTADVSITLERADTVGGTS